jgi:hypothetical protein
MDCKLSWPHIWPHGSGIYLNWLTVRDYQVLGSCLASGHVQLSHHSYCQRYCPYISITWTATWVERIIIFFTAAKVEFYIWWTFFFSLISCSLIIDLSRVENTCTCRVHVTGGEYCTLWRSSCHCHMATYIFGPAMDEGTHGTFTSRKYGIRLPRTSMQYI